MILIVKKELYILFLLCFFNLYLTYFNVLVLFKSGNNSTALAVLYASLLLTMAREPIIFERTRSLIQWLIFVSYNMFSLSAITLTLLITGTEDFQHIHIDPDMKLNILNILTSFFTNYKSFILWLIFIIDIHNGHLEKRTINILLALIRSGIPFLILYFADSFPDIGGKWTTYDKVLNKKITLTWVLFVIFSLGKLINFFYDLLRYQYVGFDDPGFTPVYSIQKCLKLLENKKKFVKEYRKNTEIYSIMFKLAESANLNIYDINRFNNKEYKKRVEELRKEATKQYLRREKKERLKEHKKTHKEFIKYRKDMRNAVFQYFEEEKRKKDTKTDKERKNKKKEFDKKIREEYRIPEKDIESQEDEKSSVSTKENYENKKIEKKEGYFNQIYTYIFGES